MYSCECIGAFIMQNKATPELWQLPHPMSCSWSCLWECWQADGQMELILLPHTLMTYSTRHLYVWVSRFPKFNAEIRQITLWCSDRSPLYFRFTGRVRCRACSGRHTCCTSSGKCREQGRHGSRMSRVASRLSTASAQARLEIDEVN